MQRTRATGASVVVLDVNTGAVRAMVSLPSFASTTLSGGADPKAYAALVNDTRNPFLNRATAGLYPSGSTIKPFVGAAALFHDILTPNERVDASAGKITVKSVYDENISWTFHDWTAHGFVNMTEAIARSSNVYFYTAGGGFEEREGLGIERLVAALRAFGFGSPTGIDLPGEAAGRIPTPEWKRETLNEAWFIGDTYNLSIGQGNFGVTPLQLAVGTAAIANGGTRWRPHVVEALLTASGEVAETKKPEVVGTVPFDAASLTTVRQGMRMAVTAPFGTNRSLATLPISAAAKTGTAQFGNEGKTHALVTAFAPYEKPELAIAVVLEGGGNSPEATRVARDILEWYATNAEN
jgi:penicillin-binding protein 2